MADYRLSARPPRSWRPLVEELEPRLLLTLPVPDHVVIVIEENHGYSQIIGSSQAPFINFLANNGALFTKSYAIEHPSQPNYLDLFSGSNQGIHDDSCPHTFSTPNLGGELEAASIPFGGYSEDMPSVGYTGCTYQKYARKHNPWVNFTDIPAADNMPYAGYFPKDFTTLPQVSFVIPNQNNDMHDGSIGTGDTWLNNNLRPYVKWALHNNSLFIMTFDEDNNLEGNHIATIFVGQMVSRGQYSETINHYNILRTLEDMYGLPYAGQSANVDPISDVWNNGAAPATDSPGSAADRVGLTGRTAAALPGQQPLIVLLNDPLQATGQDSQAQSDVPVSDNSVVVGVASQQALQDQGLGTQDLAFDFAWPRDGYGFTGGVAMTILAFARS
jgi:phosphatidylinositol-3-phosphatase